MNRFKLVGLLGDIINSKLEEAAESGVYTNKDLLDVLKLMHEIRKDEIKLLEMREGSSGGTQNNTQINNYGNDSLSALINNLMAPK